MTVHKCQNKNQSKYFQICRNYWVFFPNALDTGKKKQQQKKTTIFSSRTSVIVCRKSSTFTMSQITTFYR